MNKNKRSKVVKEIEHHTHRVYREWNMEALIILGIGGCFWILVSLIVTTSFALLELPIDKSLVLTGISMGGVLILIGVFFGWALGDLKTFQGY